MSTLTETKGDLFASPDYSVLVHACNCRGAWGKGIAKRFRELYPAAYAIYRTHCLTSLDATPPTAKGTKEQKRALLGTALLIPPQSADLPRRHWIGCLFTRWDYRGKSDVEGVLEATREAVRDLLGLLRLEAVRREGEEGEGGEKRGVRIGEVYACRINAGLFGVEWGDTRRVLVEEGVAWRIVEFEQVSSRRRARRGRRGVVGGEGMMGEEGGFEKEERMGRAERDMEAAGMEGDGLCAEKAIGNVEVGEHAAFGGVGFVSSSTRAATGRRMRDEDRVDARRGKRQRLV